MGCSRLKSCRGTNETRWATFGVLLTEQKQNTHILQECISPSYGKGWRRWGCLPRWCRFDLFHSESEADPSPCSAETWFTQLGSLTHPKYEKASVCPASSQGLLRQCIITARTGTSTSTTTTMGAAYQQSSSRLKDGWKYPLGNWDWLYHSIRQCGAQIW